MNLSNSAKGLRVSVIILSLMTLMFGTAVLTNPIPYTALVLVLLYEYFVLLGGTLNWLNRKLDITYMGTGLYRRILAADAKLILFAVLATLWLTYWSYTIDYSQIPEIKDCALTYNLLEYIHHLTNPDADWSALPIFIHKQHTHFIPVSVLIIVIKLFLLGQLTHSIHHLILNERIAGMRTAVYPPITRLIARMMKWARGEE